MEHRGVPYTIRQGIERDTWTAVVHLPAGKTTEKAVIGSRNHANRIASSMIDKALDQNQPQGG